MVNNYWKYKEAKTQEISSLMGQEKITQVNLTHKTLDL